MLIRIVAHELMNQALPIIADVGACQRRWEARSTPPSVRLQARAARIFDRDMA